MFRRFSINFALISMGLDACLVALGLELAFKIRPFLPNYRAIAPQETASYFAFLYILFPIAWVFIFLLLSLYDGRRNLRVVDEFTTLTVGSLVAAVALAGLLYLTFRDVARSLFLLFVLITYLLMVLWRSLARLGFRVGWGAASQRRVLIVGAGLVGKQLQEQIQKSPYLGLSMVGFLDDNHKTDNSGEILGTLEDAKKITVEQCIDDVVIALPQRAYEKANKLVAELHSLPVKVWVIPDYFRLALHKAVVEDFAGLPMLDLRAPALNDYQRMIKRAFDLAITILFLPPSLVLMGLVALAIRLEGPGPIIFRQQRVGENGRLFEMYKFRTMVPNAEQLRHLVEHFDDKGNLIHKTKNDPRVTRVGYFLRQTSIDELPQLFNILKGEMSLVGPRPELPYLVDKYEPWQRQRFAVPQGITGWWQVNGRSDKPMHLNTDDDLYYVQNYSLFLDITILIKTVGTVLRRKGAF